MMESVLLYAVLLMVSLSDVAGRRVGRVVREKWAGLGARVGVLVCASCVVHSLMCIVYVRLHPLNVYRSYGVHTHNSSYDIRQRYLHMCKYMHPDVYDYSRTSQSFHQMHADMKLLINDRRRRIYDRLNLREERTDYSIDAYNGLRRHTVAGLRYIVYAYLSMHADSRRVVIVMIAAMHCVVMYTMMRPDSDARMLYAVYNDMTLHEIYDIMYSYIYLYSFMCIVWYHALSPSPVVHRATKTIKHTERLYRYLIEYYTDAMHRREFHNMYSALLNYRDIIAHRISHRSYGLPHILLYPLIYATVIHILS